MALTVCPSAIRGNHLAFLFAPAVSAASEPFVPLQKRKRSASMPLQLPTDQERTFGGGGSSGGSCQVGSSTFGGGDRRRLIVSKSHSFSSGQVLGLGSGTGSSGMEIIISSGIGAFRAVNTSSASPAHAGGPESPFNGGVRPRDGLVPFVESITMQSNC